jgi:hypothetical protein
MSATRRFDLLSRKVIIVVILAASSMAAILIVAPSIAQATAQQQQHQKMRMMGRSGEGIPQINGSVSIANETRNFINENVNVSFVEAAQAAQWQILY